MNPFTFQCGTKMIFGAGTESQVGQELVSFGATKVLLVYGGQSIRRSGLYDRVCSAMTAAGLSWTELAGVVPNPRVSLVREGIRLCKENGVDFLLAVGGGSVIDTCKAISFGYYYPGDVWDLVSHSAQPGDQRLPVGAILTLPAAGSEESDSCVISDEKLKIKGGFGSPLMRPVFSIMNPELTCTLPLYQTACGCMDIMAHAMERYFSRTKNTEVTDRLGEAMMKVIVHNLPKVVENPHDLNARGEIMLAGTFAQNDLTGVGREQDWFNHGLEHQISGFYDIAHGAGLAISFPAWMELTLEKDECVEKVAQYAVRVWGVEMDFAQPRNTAREGIGRLRNMIKSVKLPSTLSEAGIGTERFEEMANNLTDVGKSTCGAFCPMSKEDIVRLLKAMQ
ncbi:MAG: iron-containing alcohol dehydrogenase [Eubacteriales bacterium]|nr:iron-containing alcohol dehydrogenase [Eubacteriales bacterium]